MPHDEGAIGQSAERVLEGQLPHRDFDELYTGGLSYLNAFAFRVFGENLASPRIVLFIFFVAWIPAFFWVACRFASPLAAGAITLLAIVYSLPNYTAAVPSWYNLFFATFGMGAILQYLRRRTLRWVLIAGLAGGVSFLFKLSGLYFVAGALLFFVYREQETDASECTRSHSPVYSAFVAVALLAFSAALFMIARKSLSGVAVFEFIVPGEILALVCIWRQIQPSSSPGSERFQRLFAVLLPFLVGGVLPVGIFLVPYICSHSVGDFLNGVFVLPGQRLAFAARRPSGFGLNKLLATAALLFLIWAAYAGKLRSRLTRILLAFAFVLSMILSKSDPRLYGALWSPPLLLIPFSTIAASLILSQRSEGQRRLEIFLVIAFTATCTLIQLPFSAGIYFCYVAPLLALSLVAIFSVSRRPSRALAGLLILFYACFVIFRVTPSFIYSMSYFYQPDPQTVPLDLPRGGGLRVNAGEADLYHELIPLVEAHAGSSPFIYAAPDCPEVYFLADRKNPTHTIFDFFDNPKDHSQRVIHAIEANHVNVVAILREPPFSPPLSQELMAQFQARFPFSRQVGRFEVRWRTLE